MGYDQAPRGDRDAPEFAGIGHGEVVDGRLVRNREVTSAVASTYTFEARVVAHFREAGIPGDVYLEHVENLVAFVWLSFLDRIANPDLYEEADETSYADDAGTVFTEAQAHAAGLNVFEPEPAAKPVRQPSILPGCEGEKLVESPGWRCPKGGLRPYGRRMCPACSAAYLEQERARRTV